MQMDPAQRPRAKRSLRSVIAVVTGEPLPSRLVSLALGTGDLDCVYHFALYELQATLKALNMQDASDLLAVMVNGKRLKDISDLPMDLAV